MTPVAPPPEPFGARPTRDDVVAAYRYLLGREPESEAAIAEKLHHFADRAALRESFIESDEFRAAFGGQPVATIDGVEPGYHAHGQSIEYQVSPGTLTRLTERIRRQWTKLGEEEPYWSVLTDDAYRTAAMDAGALDRFHRSGAEKAALIDLIGARGEMPSVGGVCVELGCGVGRVTRHLAERFARVIAVDISAGNLALCRRYLDEQGVANVDTVAIVAIEDLANLPEFDYLFSVIVLQHNPPPVQYEMLRLLFAKVRRGGSCLFQTLTDLPGYGFDADAYLASAEPVMEIHTLPMPAILRLLRQSGLELGTVRMDHWTGTYGSYTFGAYRR